jgi:hypothetical protein
MSLTLYARRGSVYVCVHENYAERRPLRCDCGFIADRCRVALYFYYANARKLILGPLVSERRIVGYK